MRAILFFLSACFFGCLGANASVISLQGYAGADFVESAKQKLNALEKGEPVIFEINSFSGDLAKVLDLASALYAKKQEKKQKVIVYIRENALGPAAVLPFLADELYISIVVSWGDIPLGTEQSLPTNILRNRVVSLISDDNPHAGILKVLAIGMTDPNVSVGEDNGWKVISDKKEFNQTLISTKGETLVVNQNQLRALKLVKDVITLENFQELFPYKQSEQKALAPAQDTILLGPHEKIVESLKKHIKLKPDGNNKVGLIKIEDRQNGISQSTWLYVKGALDHYKETKPAFVILELNTPGGEVYPAQLISDALKDLDTQHNIPVVAYINNWAISAGAMLAYSSRYIVIVKDASMGAAEPVLAGQTGELKEASEKVNSALRADFANRANFFDRNPSLAEGMVDKDLILVMRHGKIAKLDNENQIRTTGPDKDVLIKAKGKLLTLNSQQLMDYGVADFLVQPAKLDPITQEELQKGEWAAEKELLFTAPFFKDIKNATIEEFKPDWKLQFFMILAHPIVSSLLFLGMMLGFYMEMNTPGVTLPGSIAAICLFLIILSSFAQEIGNILELIFLVTGLLIILVELFVLPTFGLLGFAGILLFLAGLFGLMLPGAGSISFDFDTQTLNAAGEAFMKQLVILSLTIVVGSILIALLARYVMPSFSALNRFVLKGREQEGYVAVSTGSDLPKIGTLGEVAATLRPAGKVRIGDDIYDAISTGSFIEKGSKIKVIGHESGNLIVAES